MKDNVEKRNKTIHIIEKWFIIGIILFIIIQIGGLAVIEYTLPKEERKIFDQGMDEFQKDYMGHWYNGTYFINMMISENFDSQDKYESMIEEIDHNPATKICYYAGTSAAIIGVILILNFCVSKGLISPFKGVKLISSHSLIGVIWNLKGISIILLMAK